MFDSPLSSQANASPLASCDRGNTPGFEKPIIFFDGVCHLCNAWCKFILTNDVNRHFLLCTVQSPEGQTLLAEHGYSTDHFDTMLLLDRGKMFEKTEAFFRIIEQLHLPWSAMLIFRVVPLRVRDWCYDRIALNRYRLFGKKDTCMMPTPNFKERFLRMERQHS